MNVLQESIERVSRAAQRLGNRLSTAFGPQPAWMVKKQAVDAEFDSALGVETGGVTMLNRLDVAGNAGDGVPHIASDPEEFSSAMDALAIDFKRFTFVDLGAGKGRAMLMASQYGFKRLIGVEFARELAEVARRNIQVAGPAVSARARIVHQDATTYELPNDPVVVFMYNPFGARTMSAVADRTRASFDRHPRPLHIVYLVPEQLETWTAAGFVAEQRDHYAVLRPVAPLPS